MAYKLGCLPRTFVDHRIPSWGEYRMVFGSSWVDPGSVNYAAGMPADIGFFGNDAQGDCVFAAAYHFIQGATLVARGHMITEPDNLILASYHELTGSGDNGTDPNAFFPYAIGTGLQILPAPAPRVRHKFLGAFAVDPTVNAYVREAIDLCGGVQIAFSVPAYIMDDGTGKPRKHWDLDPAGDQSIVGGHMVWAPGFSPMSGASPGELVIASWGAHDYSMSPAFLAQFGQGAWGIVDPSFVMASGRTPFGQTIAQLEAVMKALSGG